jgi:hypothetical protein
MHTTSTVTAPDGLVQVPDEVKFWILGAALAAAATLAHAP